MYWYSDISFFKEDNEHFLNVRNKLSETFKSGSEVFPPLTKIFRAFDETPFEQTKVVILGQDPYPTVGHANGLAFSVESDVKPLPKSLINIFKELKSDIGVDRTDGDLTAWAKQGVLLLNDSLTVVEGKPGSHSAIGWEYLTNEVLEKLSSNKKNLVFILWGKKAQAKKKFIVGDHLIIESPHPSPLSAHRGFFGSKPFSRTNKYLIEHNKRKIEW